jgi:hypothetical protein
MIHEAAKKMAPDYDNSTRAAYKALDYSVGEMLGHPST